MSTSAPQRRTFIAAFVLVAAAIVASLAWVIASPVGSSPDEDFHVGSMWCPPPVDETGCQISTKDGEKAVMVPQSLAKEYVTCHDGPGALVLSEFTGAAGQLRQAFMTNPHDIGGLKQAIMDAIETPEKERARRMKALRNQVAKNDVQHWAETYLAALRAAPEKPAPTES